MKKFILMVLATICMSVPCYAAVDFETDMENELCNLFGTVEEAAFNQSVSIVIKDKFSQEVHVSYAETDNDGNFSYSFTFDNWPTDEYEVSIGAYGLDDAMVLEKKLFYASTTDRAIALGEINTTASNYKDELISESEAIGRILSTISTKARILEVDNSLYSGASDTLKTTLAKKILDGAPYAKISDFKNLYNPEFGAMIMSEATNENVDDVISEMWEVYNFEGCSTYEIYDGIQNKNAVHLRFVGGEYSSLNDVRVRFEQSTILDKLQKAGNITDAQFLYDNYSGIFSFSYSIYPKWSTRDMAMASKGLYFATMADLKSTLDTKHNTPPADTNPPVVNNDRPGSVMSTVPSQVITTQEKKSSFNDMQSTQWAIDAVEHLYNQGIVSGNDKGGFEPSRSISREEFVKIVVNAFSLNDNSAVCEFSDVTKDSWSYEFVAAAVSKGIVKGTDDNFFNAKGNITRQDMAVIIKRAVDYVSKSYDTKRNNTGFTDKGEIADYAVDAVEYLYKTGILNGFEDGSFRPHNTATRAEAACLLYNVIS